MGKKVKVKDIAARLGLSSTLVSLVLNNKADQHGIKRETQERVMVVAHKMGYFQQKGEENSEKVVEEAPGLIGMIVPSMSDPFVIELVPYIQKALASIGIGLSVMTKDPFDRRLARLITGFRKFFSGLILVGETADEITVRTLKNGDYPFILVENNPQNMRLNLVRSDNQAGIEMLVRHIESLGYKRVVVIRREQPVNSVKEDIASLKIQVRDNIPDAIVNDATIARIPGVNTIDTELLAGFIRPPYRTELLVISEATLVYPVLEYLLRNNIRVPQDIAFVSIEEGTAFDLLATPVTAIRRQVPELASKAAKMIWTEIKNSGKSKYRRSGKHHSRADDKKVLWIKT
ncbi:MAG: LacI family DNA-binding transcriptional regulator [Bacteroidales bacterium]